MTMAHIHITAVMQHLAYNNHSHTRTHTLTATLRHFVYLTIIHAHRINATLQHFPHLTIIRARHRHILQHRVRPELIVQTSQPMLQRSLLSYELGLAPAPSNPALAPDQTLPVRYYLSSRPMILSYVRAPTPMTIDVAYYVRPLHSPLYVMCMCMS